MIGATIHGFMLARPSRQRAGRGAHGARAGQGRGNVHLRDGRLRLGAAAWAVGITGRPTARHRPVRRPVYQRRPSPVRHPFRRLEPSPPSDQDVRGSLPNPCRTVRQGGPVVAFEERLRALSRARALLSHAGSDTVEVGALIRAEVAAHASGARDRPTIAGPRVSRKTRQIQSFAPALHELTTDAVESGALTVETGRLDATWESSSTGADAGDGPGAGSRAVSPSIRRRRRAGATARS